MFTVLRKKFGQSCARLPETYTVTKPLVIWATSSLRLVLRFDFSTQALAYYALLTLAQAPPWYGFVTVYVDCLASSDSLVPFHQFRLSSARYTVTGHGGDWFGEERGEEMMRTKGATRGGSVHCALHCVAVGDSEDAVRQVCGAATPAGQPSPSAGHDAWTQKILADIASGVLDVKRETSFLISCSIAGHVDIVRAMIQKGANINAKDEVFTALARTINAKTRPLKRRHAAGVARRSGL